MEEMLRLHEHNDVDATLVTQLRVLWDKVRQLELEARAKPQV